jgi:hypothetical protein
MGTRRSSRACLAKMASRKGLEPPTCVGNRRSIRLSYRDQTPRGWQLSAVRDGCLRGSQLAVHPQASISMFWTFGKCQARGRHASKSTPFSIARPVLQIIRDAKAALGSALRFEVEADCLCPVADVEFAKQIAQMKLNRIDRHAEFPRQAPFRLAKWMIRRTNSPEYPCQHIG